jgi:hypothetical protein
MCSMAEHRCFNEPWKDRWKRSATEHRNGCLSAAGAVLKPNAMVLRRPDMSHRSAELAAKLPATRLRAQPHRGSGSIRPICSSLLNVSLGCEGCRGELSEHRAPPECGMSLAMDTKRRAGYLQLGVHARAALKTGAAAPAIGHCDAFDVPQACARDILSAL